MNAIATLLRRSQPGTQALPLRVGTLELDPLRVQLKVGGGHAGHNGLKSINAHVGTPDYARVRVGVGRPPGPVDPADYVLGPGDTLDVGVREGVTSRAVAEAVEAERVSMRKRVHALTQAIELAAGSVGGGGRLLHVEGRAGVLAVDAERRHDLVAARQASAQRRCASRANWVTAVRSLCRVVLVAESSFSRCSISLMRERASRRCVSRSTPASDWASRTAASSRPRKSRRAASSTSCRNQAPWTGLEGPGCSQ